MRDGVGQVMEWKGGAAAVGTPETNIAQSTGCQTPKAGLEGGATNIAYGVRPLRQIWSGAEAAGTPATNIADGVRPLR